MLQQEMMALWQNCFGDDADFVSFYFQEKFREENAVVARNALGRLTAALQMIPYALSFSGAQVPVAHISGAAIREEQRGKGVMRTLFLRAFTRMNRRGIPLSVLIPQESGLFDYYARLGYAPVFSCSWWSPSGELLPLPAGWSVREYTSSEAALELFPLFDRLMKQRDVCIQHDREDYRAVCTELFTSGGCLLVPENTAGESVGVVFVLPREGEVLVTDALFSGEEEQRILVAGEIGRRWPGSRQRWKTVPSATSEVVGMARLTNVKQMLQLVAGSRPEISCSLYVTDPLIASNTGWYAIEGGRVRRTAYPFFDPAFQVTVAELAHLVLGSHPEQVSPVGVHFPAKAPFMSLILG